jgi:NTE family protein
LRRTDLWSLLLCVFLSGGCAHYHQNEHLKRYSPESGYRYPPPAETKGQDKLFLALSFSGGGTRAAALSFGVLSKLREIRIPPVDGGTTLLDEVDVISSVSGGSFTSAYYGLFGHRIFEDYRERFLYRNVQGELVGELFKPWNWVRLASPYFSRIDMAAELYDRTIFDRKSYQALMDRRQQPYVALNATNMTSGDCFTFTQEHFDFIGSDLAIFPVARAVAASSAFPFLLSPVSLVNNQAADGYELSLDIQNALKQDDLQSSPRTANMRRYLWAANRAPYHTDKADHRFLHLMDGGLADNLGLRYLMDNFRHSSGFLFQRKSVIHRLVVIVVNAKTQPPENLDMQESSPGLKDMAYKTATVSMDNFTYETVEMTGELLSASRQAAETVEMCRKLLQENCGAGDKLSPMGHRFEVYVIEINFLDVKNKARREHLLALPTTFSLGRADVDDLIQVGGELLCQSEEFQRLLGDMGASGCERK